MKNKYIRRSRISEAKFRQFLRLFCYDLDASTIACIIYLNRNTVNRYVRLLRERIIIICERSSPFSGEIEVDESYFGPRRVRGVRGRGAKKKTPVFGILERGGKVYTEIVPDCTKSTLRAIIRRKVALDSIIHSDGWGGYNGLVDMGYKKHYRIRRSHNEFARGKYHINGIESFWSYAKKRLAKYHGIAKGTFLLYLKECEFRFNHRNDDMYGILLDECRKRPLS